MTDSITDARFPLMRNGLKERLASGGVALCLRVALTRTNEIAFIADAAGFDALYVDLEHCTASLSETAQICSTANALGLTALVRIASHDDPSVCKLLDGGAMGVIAPHVDTAEQARQVVAACKFAPVGERSLAGPSHRSRYQRLPAGEFVDLANRGTLVAVMLETATAMTNAAAIAAVEGVDLLLVGTADLTANLRLPSAAAHEHVLGLCPEIAAACARHGSALGVGGVADPTLIGRYLERGVRFVSAGTDSELLLRAANARLESLRELVSHRVIAPKIR